MRGAASRQYACVSRAICSALPQAVIYAKVALIMDVRTLVRTLTVALFSIGLVILVIVLLVKGFSGHPSTPKNQVDVSTYTYKAAIATLLIDGPTNLNQNHNQLRISVSGTMNEIDVIQGYQGNVIKSQTYPNNSSAFNAFLQALQLQGFSKGIESHASYLGYCPTGNRYVYSFSSDQDELFSYWSTSCAQGTFKGNATTVRFLFEQQIPATDLHKLTSGTQVSL